MRDDRTALYRLYGDSDRLLYVGIAFVPRQRWKTHARQKPWWDKVMLREIEWFPSRGEAEAAETRAIETEHPQYNVLGREPSSRAARTEGVNTPGLQTRPIEETLAGLDARRKSLTAGLPDPSERQKVRKEYGLTQDDLASVLGVHRITVSAWERGRFDPSGKMRELYMGLFAHMKAQVDRESGAEEVVGAALEDS
ncbi:helix-turn-helix domain-containing protein [Streptomyces lavendulae]|uniref:helix-turn-helix domain-containing protein n=1 Tax=Streptomyces lavendulae TaxID=1914 RepID=UPI0033D52B5F